MKVCLMAPSDSGCEEFANLLAELFERTRGAVGGEIIMINVETPMRAFLEQYYESPRERCTNRLFLTKQLPTDHEVTCVKNTLARLTKTAPIKNEKASLILVIGGKTEDLFQYCQKEGFKMVLLTAEKATRQRIISRDFPGIQLKEADDLFLDTTAVEHDDAVIQAIDSESAALFLLATLLRPPPTTDQKETVA